MVTVEDKNEPTTFGPRVIFTSDDDVIGTDQIPAKCGSDPHEYVQTVDLSSSGSILHAVSSVKSERSNETLNSSLHSRMTTDAQSLTTSRLSYSSSRSGHSKNNNSIISETVG